jgi:hypothetical protein
VDKTTGYVTVWESVGLELEVRPELNLAPDARIVAFFKQPLVRLCGHGDFRAYCRPDVSRVVASVLGYDFPYKS